MTGCAVITGPSSGTAPTVATDRDGPPLSPIDVSTLPMPIPKNEPRIKRGNVSPYTVFGKTYEVMPTAAGYQEIGTASWYGRKFHGRLTSSGEVYDMFQLTAAHKTLPIPSYVQATNLANGKQIIVRVNDRGPFADDRIIDMSWAAAERLGFTGSGTARVELKILAHPDAVEAQPKTAAAPVTAPTPTMATFQIMALSDQARAQQALSSALETLEWLSDQGSLRQVVVNQANLWRVLLTPASPAQRADLIRSYPSATPFTE